MEWRRGWTVVSARALDLDADGLFLATTHRVPLDTPIDLVIMLPDGPVTVVGEARYVSSGPRGVGIAVLAITDEDRERWRAFYEAQLVACFGSTSPTAAPALRLHAVTAASRSM